MKGSGIEFNRFIYPSPLYPFADAEEQMGGIAPNGYGGDGNLFYFAIAFQRKIRIDGETMADGMDHGTIAYDGFIPIDERLHF